MFRYRQILYEVDENPFVWKMCLIPEVTSPNVSVPNTTEASCKKNDKSIITCGEVCTVEDGCSGAFPVARHFDPLPR